jgi:sulfite reductase (NADPH) flavoprotein alpha-component
MIELSHDSARLLGSAASVLAFAGLCWARLKPEPGIARATACDVRVLYASQTGQAEAIARRTHARLIAGGIDADIAALSAADAGTLRRTQTLLVVASTTGDGEAPDQGRAFDRRLAHIPDLSGRRFAVLALGDSQYDAFCAFGRRLHDALAAAGATPLAPCLTADDLDPDVLAQWQDLTAALGAASAAPEPPAPLWTLTARERLNPHGDAPLYRLRLRADVACDWQAGDLAEIETEDGHRRDYSIASLPDEGHVELYVREVMGRDGKPGKGSRLLLHDLSEGGTLRLRVKSHAPFHDPSGGGPLLLIGAGSGLAGLRAHLLSAPQRRPWLIYGERHPQRDAALAAEAKAWLAEGKLSRLDLAFSRPDTGEAAYVQDILRREATRLHDHLIHDGRVLVCGGLAMGRAVERCLRDVMGEAFVDQALASGRYRRDLY